ncbi:MAG: hypothetical protein HXY25_12185 [Alphaproteobacteria bacterium]|nr:hypothetical protein [Alphaproteobacteria bacterium]
MPSRPSLRTSAIALAAALGLGLTASAANAQWWDDEELYEDNAYSEGYYDDYEYDDWYYDEYDESFYDDEDWGWNDDYEYDDTSYYDGYGYTPTEDYSDYYEPDYLTEDGDFDREWWDWF